MRKSYNFEGKILFSSLGKEEKNTLMTYCTEPMATDFNQTIMASFDFLNFSHEEKKQLSNRHRKMLNRYRQINPFALNLDALELIKEIAKCKNEKITIEAHDYGVYICLAALYSGELPKNKKIEFHFHSSPLALFPKDFLKIRPKDSAHKIVFHLQESSWLSPFSTLYSHEKIKCFYNKAA